MLLPRPNWQETNDKIIFDMKNGIFILLNVMCYIRVL